MNNVQGLLVSELRNIVKAIEDGSCEMTDIEMLDLFETIAKVWMNKEECCKYLNMSRATFDRKVRNGEIPEGRKKVGYSELLWLRKDIVEVAKQ